MDIPNDLNKLLAQLKQVTSDAGRKSEIRAPGSRPTEAEIARFLRQHNFGPDAAIEQVEILQDGIFECYMFSVWSRGSDGLSLLAMQPEDSWPANPGVP